MLNNFDQSLKYQFENVIKKLHSIIMHKRKTRSLFDLLGSWLKLISGNLGEKDAENYKKAIQALQINQINMIIRTNRQMSLVTWLIDIFNRTTILLTHNQNTLPREINKTNNDFTKLIFDFYHYMQVNVSHLYKLNLRYKWYYNYYEIWKLKIKWILTIFSLW